MSSRLTIAEKFIAVDLIQGKMLMLKRLPLTLRQNGHIVRKKKQQLNQTLKVCFMLNDI